MPTPATTTALFFSSYKPTTFTKGAQLLHARSALPPPITYLVEGLVVEYAISESGTKTIINTYKPGSFFPSSAAVNHTPNRYHFEAGAQSVVRQAPADSVREFLLANPDVTYELLQRLYRGLDGLTGRLEMLLGANASSRLLYELTVQAERFGISSDNGIVVTITESELAEHTGLARETVSRELKKLKDNKILSVSRGRVVLHEIDRAA